MNVMISDISEDLDTTVQGVQIAITLFLLVMAALMIPGGKLTDRYGRKRCFTVGLVVYGVGALLSAVSPGLGVRRDQRAGRRRRRGRSADRRADHVRHQLAGGVPLPGPGHRGDRGAEPAARRPV